MKTTDKIKNSTAPGMHDVNWSVGENTDGVFFQHQQHIDDNFLSELRKEKIDSKRAAPANFHRAASIPVAVIEQWAREGFDFYRESPKAILKRLRDQDLDVFITTNKSI